MKKFYICLYILNIIGIYLVLSEIDIVKCNFMFIVVSLSLNVILILFNFISKKVNIIDFTYIGVFVIEIC